MSQSPVERTGGSRAVQGCLLGAVLLFVLLLIIMIVLGYQQFRENTAEPTVGAERNTAVTHLAMAPHPLLPSGSR